MGAGESVHAFDNFDKHLASRILRYGKYANVLQLCPPKWVSPPGQGAGTTTSVRGWRPGPCDSQGFRRPPREVDGALWLEKAMFFPIFSLEMSRKRTDPRFGVLLLGFFGEKKTSGNQGLDMFKCLILNVWSNESHGSQKESNILGTISMFVKHQQKSQALTPFGPPWLQLKRIGSSKRCPPHGICQTNTNMHIHYHPFHISR